MKEKIRKYIRIISVLNDNKDIDGNFMLWSFIRLFTSLGKLSQAAAALTYHTFFAVVPIMALMLATAMFLGYGEAFKDILGELLAGHEGLAREVLSFSESYLKNANSGYWLGAIVGLGVLLYSLFSIYLTIDSTFNSLWEQQGRSFKKLLKIFVFILLVPVVAILTLVILASISSLFKGELLHEINIVLLTTSIYISVLFISYKLIPKVHVMTKYAAISACVCGFTFALMQYFASYILGLFNGLHNIYGNLASILIMMLWVYFSWIICLVGSRWNYLLQESKRLDQENKFRSISYNYRKFLTILVLARCDEEGRRNGNGTFMPNDVAARMAERYNMPQHITINIINGMTYTGIIITNEDEDCFIISPAYSGHTISRIIKDLDTAGYNEFATHIATDIHNSNSKEEALWAFMNDTDTKDAALYDKPLSTLL